MKKILSRKIICFVFIMFMMIVVSSCHFNNDPYDSVESGDFIYAANTFCFNGKEGEVAIIGLSEQGKEKEVLVFPNMIDGYRVIAYGAKFGYRDTGPIVIEKAKKVYFCNLLIDYDCVKTVFKFNSFVLDEIYIGGVGKNSQMTYYDFIKKDISIYVDSFIFNRDYNDIGDEYILKVSTISYYLEEDSCYFVDYVENEKVSVIPPEPYKEGYTFEGWYKDLDFNEKWDFDNDIVVPISKEKQFECDVDYEPIKLYAKWNVNN